AETMGALCSNAWWRGGGWGRAGVGYTPGGRPENSTPGALDVGGPGGPPPRKPPGPQRIDRPPYFAYPLRPGITFTYLGVKVNDRAQVLMKDATPAGNLYATGEIMAGNVLGRGYLAGFGMTIGTVFGRIAGAEAAKHALN